MRKRGVKAWCLIAVLIFSLVMFFKDNGESLKDYHASRVYYKKTEQKLRQPFKHGNDERGTDINFSSVKKQWPNAVYWLSLKGSEYPVMQSDDNEYYLHRLPDGQKNLGGSIFLDYRCKAEPGCCKVIYGHNMKDGSMFGKLDKFLDPRFLAKHQNGMLVGKSYSAKIVWQQCKYVKETDSIYSLVGKKGNTIVLSTCGYEGELNRIVLIGTIV